jgi:hypothetical protein
LPEGVDGLSDCPFTLHDAILTALRILAYEEFPKEERPPRNIWMDGDKLGEWWDEIERKREAKFKPDQADTPADESDWEQNAVELIQRG